MTSDFGPDIVEDIEHRWSFETIFQISDTKHSKSVFQIYIGIVIEQLGKGTRDIFGYSDRESISSLHAFQDLHQILHERRSEATIIIQFKCDTLERIGGLECFIE
jgi:hypothetical protein